MRVLSSASPPGFGTNPYLNLLHRSLEPILDVQWFSWRRALTGRYAVLHLHWPEVKLRGSSSLRTLGRSALFAALLVRCRVGRRALVRTVHNEAPHEPPPMLGGVLLRLCDRWTTAWITLNPSTRPPGQGPVTVIPHGHYRDWVAGLPRAAANPRRIVNVGLLRRYKGLEELLEALAEVPDGDLELRVVGAPADAEVAETVRAAAGRDRRISLEASYVDDAQLVEEVTAAQLVVLPHAGAGNSGALLMALSLDRPVLVPSGPVSDRLAEEVGAAWIQTYRGPLRGEHLLGALERARHVEGSPDLSSRDWPALAAAHARVFADAAGRVRRRRGGSAARLRPAGGFGDRSAAARAQHRDADGEV